MENTSTYKHGKYVIVCLLGGLLLTGQIMYAQSTSIDDSELTTAVETEFLTSESVPAFLVDVSSLEGIVRLSGKVNDLLAKERAEKIAETVKGVRGVVNAIQVRESQVPDNEIKGNINAALLNNPATESMSIDAQVNDGRVDLTGAVNSWQEKELAALVVMGLEGVRTVDNNIDFVYERNRTDYDIKQDIEEALHWDIRLDDALIDVAVDNGAVTLTGMVGSASEKSWAEIRAWVAGVGSINMQQLEVEPLIERDKLRQDKYKYVADEQIQQAVEDALIYDPRVKSYNPEISVYNGQVFLTGTVDNLQAKKAAAEDAWNVVGVWSVKNKIKVSKADVPKDVQLAATAKEIINNDQHLNGKDILVAAEDGVVYLAGNVDSHFERYRAAQLASTVKGAISIENNLKIGGEIVNPETFNYYPNYRKNSLDPVKVSETSDTEIKDNIAFQYKWSPFVDENQVTVTVSDGIARLEGTVDSWIESRYAVLNAYEGGAFDVDNNLEIDYDEYKSPQEEGAGR